MKSIFTGSLIVLLFLNIQNSFSKIITVSNSNTNPADYKDIQIAHDNSANNDTLYVSGSETSYGYLNIKKPITVIGAGYNPNKQSGLPTKLDGVTFYDLSSNTHLEGIYIQGSGISLSVSNPIKNIVIEKCRIRGNVNLSQTDGWVFKNNIIDNTIFSNAAFPTNLFISNNIFTGINNFFNTVDGISTTSNMGTIMVSNNLFVSTYNLVAIKNTIFNNNIFYGFSPYLDNTDQNSNSGNTFNKNIIYGSSHDDVNLSGTNTGSGNIKADPNFVDGPLPLSNQNPAYDALIYDYHLNSNSPGKSNGTDGTDIGIYGGPYPFPIGGLEPFITSPGPSIPQITRMDIINSAIPVNGTLKVNVKGKIQE